MPKGEAAWSPKFIKSNDPGRDGGQGKQNRHHDSKGAISSGQLTHINARTGAGSGTSRIVLYTFRNEISAALLLGVGRLHQVLAMSMSKSAAKQISTRMHRGGPVTNLRFVRLSISL